MTDDPDVRMAQSIMDYIFRRLALDYLSFEDRSMLGIYSADERQRHLETGSYEPIEETGSASELVSTVVEPVETTDENSVVEPGSVVEPVETTDAVVEPVETKKQAHTSAELLEQITGSAVDSPLCMTCGTKMRPAGSCYVCEGCGSTSGCS
jgi:ribonucleoside-diphosphate reductase alpha chain